MGACTSSPAKEDARPLQAMNKVNPPPTQNHAAKLPPSSPSTSAPSPATVPQPARNSDTPRTSTPLASEVGAAPAAADNTDLTAFLNDGPVSPTQADVAAGVNGHGKTQRERSSTTDKQEESRKFTKECKLLLLGKPTCP
jgi:hypothetical protein